jgi:hypothetical protein
VPPLTPLSSTVELSVEVSPAQVPGLNISIGGEPVDPTKPRRVVSRASAPLEVTVSAPGYRSVTQPIVPDRNRVFGVTLAPLQAAAPPATSVTRPAAQQPAPPKSGVIRRSPY